MTLFSYVREAIAMMLGQYGGRDHRSRGARDPRWFFGVHLTTAAAMVATLLLGPANPALATVEPLTQPVAPVVDGPRVADPEKQQEGQPQTFTERVATPHSGNAGGQSYQTVGQQQIRLVVKTVRQPVQTSNASNAG